MTYQMTHPYDIRLSGKRASRYSSRTADLGRNDVLITRGIYHGAKGSDVIPFYPHNLRGYPDYPNTAKRNYRPTVAW